MAKQYKRAESRARYFTRKIAQEKGWNIHHPQNGGDFLEEQEISDYLPGSGLGLSKPDFLLCLNGEPQIIIETKNNFKKIDEAINQAIAYCDTINRTGRYHIRFAVGVSGDDMNGCIVKIKYHKDGVWSDLTAKGNPITALLSKSECQHALESDNCTTDITIPSSAEFIDAAIEVSNILRTAKIETSLRPKVIGTFAIALYHGEVDLDTHDVLSDINRMASEAIERSDHFSDDKKRKLVEAIILSRNDFERLEQYAFRIIAILKRLNIRAVLQSDADFLGMFYEAFLRYGTDNNAMGIVFTPRHITRLCVEMAGIEIGHNIIDVTCGTGGFLVSAFDALKKRALNNAAAELIRESIYGFDTNPTVWSLACLNMFFRGDGKSHIENVSSLMPQSRDMVRGRFHRAFLNPPFHQAGEPERDFIDASMDALIQGGIFVGVVYAGVFADEDNARWREEFMRKHTLLGMVSLPDELFYPNASAITTIIIAKAHEPQPKDSSVFMGRISNDGFEKLKGKRVECPGNQIPMIASSFRRFMSGEEVGDQCCMLVKAEKILAGNEFSPQQYLRTGSLSDEDVVLCNNRTLFSLFQAITSYPDITESLNPAFDDFGLEERIPVGRSGPLSDFFYVRTGKSSGAKGYFEGIVPYVSSGDGSNGVVGLVSAPVDEICAGCITVSAFGTAYLQPWYYVARGNGGSSVRVLTPKFRMTVRELLWCIAQINSQRWRFNYARQAIKSRLEDLEITMPPSHLDDDLDMISKIRNFKDKLSELSAL